MTFTLRIFTMAVFLSTLIGCNAETHSISMHASGHTSSANINGVSVQVTDGGNVQVDNSILTVNGKRYGAVHPGDSVEVTRAGVFINGVKQ